MGVNVDRALLDAVFGPDSVGDTADERARTSKRLFVRSQGQLAVDNARATGLHLTAWQAFQAFGFDVLVETLEYGSAILAATPFEPAATLTAQRERLGLSQADLASALHLPVETIADAENPSTRSEMKILARIAQPLVLDETRLGFVPGAGADTQLAVRLREFGGGPSAFASRTVLQFDEAAWVVATQARLWQWIGDRPNLLSRFQPSPEYGDRDSPAWRQGYDLAHKTRNILSLGERPIPSMRDLLERVLGLPLVQMELPERIGGATVSVNGSRGVVANTLGHNKNVWVRRATLAHELGHLLWDPEQRLRNLVVDAYADLEGLRHDDHVGQAFDPVEARANAFAIELLAPQDGVRRLFEQGSSKSEGLRVVMEHYGISYMAARYHVWNALYRTIELNDLTVDDINPTQDWEAAESFTLDYFRPQAVPLSRRGRFAREVARADEANLIVPETAALYLACGVSEYIAGRETILDLHA